MYVIYPAEEVVSLTFTSHWLPRPRPRPTLDTLAGPPVPAPSPAPALSPAPARSRTPSFLKTAPPEIAERAPASPTPSLDRPAKLRERTKVKLLKKLGRVEDPEFGKIVRTPAPDEFELPAPLPTPAFSRKNIFDRNFDALFEVATTPQFGAHIRVTTPEPDHHPDVVAEHFPSSSSLLPPRPYSEPVSITPSPTPSTRTSTPSTPTLQRSSYEGANSKPKKVSFFRKLSRSKGVSQPPEPSWKMIQQPSIEMALRELTHPTHNDQLKNQQQVTFKLVKTVSDFSSQLSQLYERHSAELQMLVANFRKRNSELRKERTTCPSSLFHTWESLIQEVEADVVAYSTASASLERVVATPLVDKTFHMKVQARKLFAHREGCELLLGKADEQLNKTRQDYRTAFVTYSNSPNPGALAAYYDSHNTYVQQLTATNAMLDQYHKFTLPTILQELEEILTDVTAAVSEAICQGGEIISDKCNSRLRRYESLCAQARAVSSTADLAHLARNLLNNQPAARPPRRAFLPPYPPEPDDPPMDIQQESMPPVLRGEMLLDRMGIPQARLSYEQLRKDSQDLELQIKQLQDHLESLARVQARGIEGNIYSKVNEIQEEMSMKKYDYRTAQLHLAAVRAQDIMASIFNIEDYKNLPLPRVILTDYNTSLQNMKNNKSPNKTREFVDDDNVRYKINTKYFKQMNIKDSEENILYKFPDKKIENKLKAKVNKSKIKAKVKFWTGKKSLSRLENLANNEGTNRRHTIATNAHTIESLDSIEVGPATLNNSLPNKVCILPPSQFTDRHVPMVAVPDDLIMNLNERGLSSFNNLGDDINNFVNGSSSNGSNSLNDAVQNPIYDNELEFFSKYVVQKLRNMETNQRIFAENLVNTALMLGQLGKLNIKSKITDS